jgi:hypothetical protein
VNARVRRKRPWQPAFRALIGSGVLAAVCLAAPVDDGPMTLLRAVPAEAQVTAETRSEATRAEGRYLRARDAFDGIRAAAQGQMRRYDGMTESLQRIRGDAARERELFRMFIQEAARLQDIEVAMREGQAELEEARREYLQALDRHEDALLDRLEASPPPTPAERARLSNEIAEIGVERRRLERERGALVQEVMLRPVPDLVVTERDSPQEILWKAEFLEDDIAGYFDTIIERLDREIAAVERRLQLERAGADQDASLSRFDADRPPGTGFSRPPGAARPSEDSGAPSEGESMSFSDFPLPDQLGYLRSIREQAQAFRTEALDRARSFRAMLDGSRR